MSFKSAKVIMLPTNKGGYNLWLNKNNNLVYHKFPYGIGKPQHLYIISDDEIKDDDWCYHTNNKSILKINKGEGKLMKEHLYLKKIIATTDESLKLPCSCSGMKDKVTCNWMCKTHRDYMLPQPSQSFIEKYVESYNNGKPIVDVLVEYEDYYCKNNHYQLDKGVCRYPYCNEFNYSKLKINPKDNTITIKRIKDNYSRDELEKLCRLSWSAGVNHESLAKRGFKQEASSYFIDNWIKYNL